MDQARWDLVNQIFSEALELPVQDRLEFVSRQCQQDAELRNEVEALLREAEKTDNRSDSTDLLEGLIAAPTDRSRRDEMVGSWLSNFHLTKLLGNGGSGTVYLGERTGEFYQRAAVKILRADRLDNEVAVTRFQRERQLLASLHHSGIAQLLSGGTTEDGRPYFVAEYVQGEPITSYCQNHALNPPARLELFRQVCAAVAYAHDQGVVHRDLKPENILVRSDDGVVKIVDFGTAKLLKACSSLDAVFPETLTADGWLPLTPAYASPEQVIGDQITPSSDIFSLGVVLFELTTGRRPFVFEDTSIVEVARTISQGAPTWRTHEATTEYQRDNPPQKEFDQNGLVSDLKLIVGKALRPEPKERYSTVQEFDEDVEACLMRRPVLARSDALSYVLRTLWRKQRSNVWLSLAVLVLIALSTVTAWQWGRVSVPDNAPELSVLDASQAFSLYQLGERDRAIRMLDEHREQIARTERSENVEWSLLAGLIQFPEPVVLTTKHGSITEVVSLKGTNRIVSVTDQGSIEIWDLDTNALVRQLEPAGEPLYSLSVSSNGKWIAAAGTTLAIWDLETGKRQRTIKSYPTNVESLVFAHNDEELIVGYRYEALERVRLRDGLTLKNLPFHNAFLSIQRVPGEKLYVCPATEGGTQREKLLQLRSASLDEVLAEFRYHCLEFMAFSSDGKWMAASSPFIDAILLFDVKQGTRMSMTMLKGSAFCRSLTFARDDSLLVSGHNDGTFQLWPVRNLSGGSEPAIFLDETRVRVIKPGSGLLKTVHFAKDGRLITGNNDRHLKIWKVPEVPVVSHDLPMSIGAGVEGHAATDVDRFIIADRAGNLWVNTLGSLEEWHEVNPAEEGELGYTISPDGNTMVVSRARKPAQLIDISQPDKPHRVGSLPDSGMRGPAPNFSSDGRYLAAVCDSYRVVLWDIGSREIAWQRAFEREPTSVAFAPDSHQLAVGGSQNEFSVNELLLLDMPRGREVARLPSGSATASLMWSPNGKVIADVQQNGKVILIPVDRSTPIERFHVVGSPQLSRCAFSPDSRTLVTGSHDGTIQLWSVQNGRRIAVLYQTVSRINNVGFAADGESLWALVDDQPRGLPNTMLRWELR